MYMNNINIISDIEGEISYKSNTTFYTSNVKGKLKFDDIDNASYFVRSIVSDYFDVITEGEVVSINFKQTTDCSNITFTNLNLDNATITSFGNDKLSIIPKLEVERLIANSFSNTIPKRLSILQNVDANSNRQSAFVYVDDNGKSCKMSIADMLSKIIRTSNTIPNDLQENEYLFLELKES